MNIITNRRVTPLTEKFNQNQLCCGSLCEAIMVDGAVILRCLACGMSWEKRVDGTYAPIAAYDPARQRRKGTTDNKGSETNN